MRGRGGHMAPDAHGSAPKNGQGRGCKAICAGAKGLPRSVSQLWWHSRARRALPVQAERQALPSLWLESCSVKGWPCPASGTQRSPAYRDKQWEKQQGKGMYQRCVSAAEVRSDPSSSLRSPRSLLTLETWADLVPSREKR